MQEFIITLLEHEAQLILDQLKQLPYHIAADLITKLLNQISNQPTPTVHVDPPAMTQATAPFADPTVHVAPFPAITQ